jgi:hypothetical protein
MARPWAAAMGFECRATRRVSSHAAEAVQGMPQSSRASGMQGGVAVKTPGSLVMCLKSSWSSLPSLLTSRTAVTVELTFVQFTAVARGRRRQARGRPFAQHSQAPAPAPVRHTASGRSARARQQRLAALSQGERSAGRAVLCRAAPIGTCDEAGVGQALDADEHQANHRGHHAAQRLRNRAHTGHSVRAMLAAWRGCAGLAQARCRAVSSEQGALGAQHMRAGWVRTGRCAGSGAPQDAEPKRPPPGATAVGRLGPLAGQPCGIAAMPARGCTLNA